MEFTWSVLDTCACIMFRKMNQRKFLVAITLANICIWKLQTEPSEGEININYEQNYLYPFSLENYYTAQCYGMYDMDNMLREVLHII